MTQYGYFDFLSRVAIPYLMGNGTTAMTLLKITRRTEKTLFGSMNLRFFPIPLSLRDAATSFMAIVRS